jgi:hypothetical protein
MHGRLGDFHWTMFCFCVSINVKRYSTSEGKLRSVSITSFLWKCVCTPNCWKAAGMSLAKSCDLRGFYAGIVCTIFFYGFSWIGSVTSINKYFNVGYMTLCCHCINKIHHSPSLADTHSLRVFDIYSCWGNTVRLRKQNRRVTWLGLQIWPLCLTILLQKLEINRLF